jgi:hypothetical protein
MGASARRTLNFTAVGGVVVGLLFLVAAYWPGRPALAGARAARSVVTISIGAPSTKLPGSFFGFSVEYPELPIYQRFRPAFERILALLKVQADGPQILRIGGNSADLTYWNPASSPLPGGAYVLSHDWFSQLRTLIADSRLRVLLDLNLRKGTAAQARGLAQQAVSKLPAGSVVGLEVGNEPDQYGHGYSSAAYVRAFKSYAHAVRQVAPHMPLLGPRSPAPTTTSAGSRPLSAATMPSSECWTVTSIRSPPASPPGTLVTRPWRRYSARGSRPVSPRPSSRPCSSPTELIERSGSMRPTQ